MCFNLVRFKGLTRPGGGWLKPRGITGLDTFFFIYNNGSGPGEISRRLGTKKGITHIEHLGMYLLTPMDVSARLFASGLELPQR